MRKSMMVQDTAMIRIYFNSCFFTAERRGSRILTGFMFSKHAQDKNNEDGMALLKQGPDEQLKLLL